MEISLLIIFPKVYALNCKGPWPTEHSKGRDYVNFIKDTETLFRGRGIAMGSLHKVKSHKATMMYNGED